jgi:hypothetical protein
MSTTYAKDRDCLPPHLKAWQTKVDQFGGRTQDLVRHNQGETAIPVNENELPLQDKPANKPGWFGGILEAFGRKKTGS